MEMEPCKVAIKEYPNTRRCFITGEYCSKQTDISKVRKTLYSKNKSCKADENDGPQHSSAPEINAFVVMNFSNMSDVAYEQRIKPFVESLTKYFYFSEDGKSISCFGNPQDAIQQDCDVNHDNLQNTIKPVFKDEEGNTYFGVEKINVVRADSNFASNFVICNRVCQQMQMADLIVVDVSVKNANVFYELGMAIAMGKLILPVCFSDSYFHMSREFDKLNLVQEDGEGKKHHHIARYTWRRHLFEYYGIRCKQINPNDDTAYLSVDDFGKWDPPLLPMDGGPANPKDEKIRVDPKVSEYFSFPYLDNKVGKCIYDQLSKSYNNAGIQDNTLLLYTMERFLKPDQAGLCIVNYHNNITRQMQRMQCFCGDRVGTLAQMNYIPESDKDDAKEVPRQLPYGVSEIIHLGVNQATYDTYQDTIKPIDFLNLSAYGKGPEVLDRTQDNLTPDYIRFLKEYTGNRSMLMYPSMPVYVERSTENVQADLLSNAGLENYFCLYHIMLRNLKYVREVVVDISDTSLESLFWLGMAHGADVYAIIVQRRETDQERKLITGSTERKDRSIFDVAGLWCAQFRTDDTQGFYHQLQSVNHNIEQQSKLLIPNIREHETAMLEQLWALPWEREGKETLGVASPGLEEGKTAPMPYYSARLKKTTGEILSDLEKESKITLESYYRTRFWKAMLKDNHVQVYVDEKSEKVMQNLADAEFDPRANVSKWDFDSVAALSSYIARRTPVGRYRINQGKGSLLDPHNMIILGSEAKGRFPQNIAPCNLFEFISEGKGLSTAIRQYITPDVAQERGSSAKAINCVQERGFFTSGEEYKEQFITAQCIKCTKEHENEQLPCGRGKNDPHTQLGQMLLWRNDVGEDRYFYVSLVGASGPSTKALTSLLVSDSLKQEIFEHEEEWKGQCLLSELQFSIRGEFISKFSERVQSSKINDELVAKATKLYLTSTLYRHFLPFLTKENENRIVNGAEYFLRSFRISENLGENAREKSFTEGNINTVITVLRELLASFRGVDALYKVSVSTNGDSEADFRIINSIEQLNLYNKSADADWLHCIYTNE